jgi:fatty acid desaturase
MERTIRYLLLAWLLLVGGVLLSQSLGHSRLAYGLLVTVAWGSPAVVALLWVVWQGLRGSFRRLQVLRRAAKWKWPDRCKDT